MADIENNNEVAGKPMSDLPPGQYRLIGWDIDTTGRRLIDEIFHLAAYVPEEKFSQYIMPYGDLNPFSQRRHCIRIITLTRYRMLKDYRLNKFLKTKSEISALNDFLTWLEKHKGKSTDGVILVCHDINKIAPVLLLQALNRYKLLERFSNVVKGFANTFLLASEKCATSVKSCSLKVLTKVLLNRDEDLRSAVNRARLSYKLVQHLGVSERQDLDVGGGGDSRPSEPYAVALVKQYAMSVQHEENELVNMRIVLDRQNTFRPVFKNMMRSNYMTRRNAIRLRRYLVEENFDLEQIKSAFESDGMSGVQEKIQFVMQINENDFKELVNLFEKYFTAEQKPMQTTKWWPKYKRKSHPVPQSAVEADQLEPDADQLESEIEDSETEDEVQEEEVPEDGQQSQTEQFEHVPEAVPDLVLERPLPKRTHE